MRDAGAVGEADLTELAVAVDPFRCALTGDPHLGSDVSDRAGSTALHQTATAFDGQRGITVGHGRVFPVERTEDVVFSILPPGDPSPSDHSCVGVNNVMTRNN